MKPPVAGFSTAKPSATMPENLLAPADANKAKIFFITNLNPKVMSTLWRNGIRVSDGQTVIGELEGASYLCWERDPGQTMIRFTAPGHEYDSGWYVRNFRSYVLNVESGKSYHLYLAGFGQRQILLERDAAAFLSVYPPPQAAENPVPPVPSPAPASAVAEPDPVADQANPPTEENAQ